MVHVLVPLVLLANPGNLLTGAKVLKGEGAPNVIRMADGVAPTDGDVWDSVHTAILAANSTLEWDLGEVKHIGAARVQADNNDFYQVTVSVDGLTWVPLWTAGPVGVPGMQTRTSDTLSADARFVRLSASGGDNMYSIGEFELYASTAARAASTLERIAPPKPPPPAPLNSAHFIVLGIAALGAWLAFRARQDNLEARQAIPASPPDVNRPS